MSRWLLVVMALLGGCAFAAPEMQPSAVPSSGGGGVADGVAVDKDPPSQDEIAKGHTFRDIYKPIALTCDGWSSSVKRAEAFCAKTLFVDGCGEKDEEGKPTGKYLNNDCPECETLTSLRAQAKAAGCGP